MRILPVSKLAAACALSIILLTGGAALAIELPPIDVPVETPIAKPNAKSPESLGPGVLIVTDKAVRDGRAAIRNRTRTIQDDRRCSV